MAPKRDVGKTVRISDVHFKVLTKLAQRWDLLQGGVVEFLLDLGDKNDLGRKDWQARLNAIIARGKRELELNEFEGLKDAPKEMVWANERFNYVEITKTGTLKITKLSPICQESLALCKEFERQVTEKREQILHDNLLMVNEAKKAELTVGITQTIKIQKCNAGASLVGNGKNFRYCRKPQAEGKGDVSIKGWCQVIQSKGPCESLAFTELPYDSYEIVEQQLKKVGRKRTNNR